MTPPDEAKELMILPMLLLKRDAGQHWESVFHHFWFRFCQTALSLSIAYVLYLSQSPFLEGTMETVLSLVIYVAYAFGAYQLLGWLCKRKLLFPISPPPEGKKALIVFLIASALALCILGCALTACWPWQRNYDTFNQWEQAASGEYNNWHPIFHTLLIWILTHICNSYLFTVVVQLLLYSLAMGYLTLTLCRSGVPKSLALTAVVLATATPVVRNYILYFGKDGAMTIGVLVLCAQTVEILRTKGDWLQKPLHAVAFGLILAFTTLVRHNALLYTIPLIACVLFSSRGFRRCALTSVGVMAAGVLLVQGALYPALDAVFPSNTLEESIGLPMSIMGNVKTSPRGLLDTETDEFLSGLISDEEWQTVYCRSDYNSIKFTYPREKIASLKPEKIARMTLSTIRANPRIAFETLNEVTSLVWGVTGENRSGMSIRASGTSRDVFLKLIELPMLLAPLRWLCENIGVQLLLLLLAALYALYHKGTHTLALIFPTLLYCLGTMLLLCGNDTRFFQFVMATSLPSGLALIALCGSDKAHGRSTGTFTLTKGDACECP